MEYTTLISADQLYLNLTNPDWVIVDCRFDLKNTEWGIESYQQAHISGAIYAHLDRDLSATVTPETGRHPLPDPDDMARRLGAKGIGNHTQVVVYDTSGGAYASRLWWHLHFLGHEKAALLNGSFQQWQALGYPVTQGLETRAPQNFIPHPRRQMIVFTEEVTRIAADPDYCLVDARAAERYRGENEPIDPVAGHIPGAVNRFHGLNLAPDGFFLSPERLRDEFQALIGGRSPENVVVYCGSGVTSCHHLVALEIAGLGGARLYAGSWSEWIRDRKRPISP